MSENLALNLIHSAAGGGPLPAVRMDDVVLSFGALDDLSAHMAGLLREHGLRPGDRVGIMLPNVPQFAVAYYGVLRAGGIVVPLQNVLLKRREVAFYLSDPDAELLLAWHEFEEEAAEGAAQAGAKCIVVRPGSSSCSARADPVREVVDRVGSDTAVILYTSGTTGPAQGRRVDRLQSAAQRRGYAANVLGRSGGRCARRAAAVSRLRSDLCAERGGGGPGVPDAHPTVQSREGAGDHSSAIG